jgi:tryptophan synthase beta chain
VNAPLPNSYRTGPDERGHFGIYGGRFVAETLMPLILELENRRRPKTPLWTLL